MELQKDTGRFQITELEERIAPDVAVSVLGIEVVNVQLNAQISGTLPLLGAFDLNVHL
jgi:hypothetical protein